MTSSIIYSRMGGEVAMKLIMPLIPSLLVLICSLFILQSFYFDFNSFRVIYHINSIYEFLTETEPGKRIMSPMFVLGGGFFGFICSVHRQNENIDKWEAFIVLVSVAFIAWILFNIASETTAAARLSTGQDLDLPADGLQSALSVAIVALSTWGGTIFSRIARRHFPKNERVGQ